jgi:AraC-like DNA-binding protein
MMDLDINNNKDFKVIAKDQQSICMSLVHEALRHVQSQGIHVDTLLQRAGIATELLTSHQARVSIYQYGNLWVEIANAMNDEFFGMDSRPLRRGSFQFLTKMLIHCDNLEQALQDALRFFNLLLDDLKGELIQQDGIAKIMIHDQQQTKPIFSYACYWMLLHSLMCWLSGQRIRLVSMQVKAAMPAAHQDYQTRFCSDIRYHSNQHALAFDASYLKLPIKQDLASRHQFLQGTPYNLLVRFKNPYALSQQIRQQLLNLAPQDWLDLSELAHRLHISEATLQRRLKAEGFSYQQLKNNIRRDRAIALLMNSNQSLQQISDSLNFHDPSAFHRAFKKWTGLNPSHYRTKG